MILVKCSYWSRIDNFSMLFSLWSKFSTSSRHHQVYGHTSSSKYRHHQEYNKSHSIKVQVSPGVQSVPKLQVRATPCAVRPSASNSVDSRHTAVPFLYHHVYSQYYRSKSRNHGVGWQQQVQSYCLQQCRHPRWTASPSTALFSHPTWTASPTAALFSHPRWTASPTAALFSHPRWTASPSTALFSHHRWTVSPSATCLDTPLHCKSEAFGKHFYQVYGTLQSAMVPCSRNIIKKAPHKVPSLNFLWRLKFYFLRVYRFLTFVTYAFFSF